MSYNYNAYGQQPPLIRPTSGLAVGGFVTAVIGLSLLGLILSVLAFKETSIGVKGGHGLAVAGAIIGGLGTLGWTLVTVPFLIAFVAAAGAGTGAS